MFYFMVVTASGREIHGTSFSGIGTAEELTSVLMLIYQDWSSITVESLR